MKTILIIFTMLCATGATAQLSANQFKQVTTMIKTASDKTALEISWLKSQKRIDSLTIKSLKDLYSAFTASNQIRDANIKVLQDSMSKIRSLYIIKKNGLDLIPGILSDTLKLN